MQLKQITVFLENRTGTLSHTCRVLADAGVNIQTLSLADTQTFGILRLIVDNWQAAADALKAAGHAVKLTDVVAVEVPHVPGGMASVLELLEQNAIDVEYMYASHYGAGTGAAVVFRFTEPQHAMTVLQTANIHIITSVEDFQK